MSRGCLAIVAVSLLTVAACHRSKSYETSVEVKRISAVRKDETGKVLTVDVEYSFSDCPGSQIEVVRGDTAFASCVAKYKVGDKLTIAIDHAWREAGHYSWTARRIGDCVREPDPNDEASYAMVRECEDWDVNGTRVGFQCRYVPERRLIDKCPWFRRR